MKISLLFFFVMVIVACVTKERKENSDVINHLPNNVDSIPKYTDHADTLVYRYSHQADTSGCLFFREDRLHIAKLENKKCIIESTGHHLFLRSGKLKMWVCKMPPKITIKNIGDTILVTADVFDLFGDENTWGKPTIIYKYAMKT